MLLTYFKTEPKTFEMFYVFIVSSLDKTFSNRSIDLC